MRVLVISLLAAVTGSGALAALGEKAASSAGEPTPGFLWPLAERTCVSSTFGEYRSRHFHSGMDLSTGGVEGREVRAVDDAEVHRVACGVFGYGRALYLRLRDGRLAVYGHLSAFSDPLEDYVRSCQERDRCYVQDLYPPAGLFPVRRGQIVGFTGQSGAGPPHLHFEIREDEEHPTNPFLAGFEAPDAYPPKPSWVGVEPLDASSRVEGRRVLALVPVRWSLKDSAYVLDRAVRVRGRVGLSVAAVDVIPSCGDRRAPYRFEVEADGREVFHARLDRASFGRGAEAELAYRPGRARGEPARLFRLHRTEGSRLELCGPVEGDGVIEIATSGSEPPRDVPFTISLGDFAGNGTRIQGRLRPDAPGPGLRTMREAARAASDTVGSVLSLELVWGRDFAEIEIGSDEPLDGPPRWWVAPERDGAEKQGGEVAGRLAETLGPRRYVAFVDPPPPEPGGWVVVEAQDLAGHRSRAEQRLPGAWLLGRGRRAEIRRGEELRVEFPRRSVFRETGVRVQELPPESLRPGLEFASAAFRLMAVEIAFDELPWVGLRTTEAAAGDTRVGLYCRDGGAAAWSYVGREVRDGRWIGARTRSLSRFGLIRDAAPPVIRGLRAQSGEGRQARGPLRPVLRANLEDVGSGFDPRGIEMTLDERWVPAEWDYERDLVSYQPPAPLARGEHRVRLRATDRAGNGAERTCVFSVP